MPTYFGGPDSPTTGVGLSANRTYFLKATCTLTGNVTDGRAYWDSGSTGNMIIGVYADSSGLPGAKLGESATFSLAGGAGWKNTTFASPFAVTNGTPYWLAWLPSSGPTMRYSTGGAVNFRQLTTTTYPTLPSSGSASTDGGVNFNFGLQVGVTVAGTTYTKAGYATAGTTGSGASQKVAGPVVSTKAGSATVAGVAAGVSQKTGPVTSTKAGYASAGAVGVGTVQKTGRLTRVGHATVGIAGSGSALIGSEFLSPALPHDLVLTPESADSFSLIPSVPGSFALTPLDEEDFVLNSHPHLDSG